MHFCWNRVNRVEEVNPKDLENIVYEEQEKAQS